MTGSDRPPGLLRQAASAAAAFEGATRLAVAARGGHNSEHHLTVSQRTSVTVTAEAGVPNGKDAL